MRLISVDRHERQHRARAEDEHRRDDRRRDQRRAADRALGILRLAGEHRDVLESAQRTHRHLAENVEAEERQRRHARRRTGDSPAACRAPCARTAARSARRTTSISITLPALCSHLLTPRPRAASAISPQSMHDVQQHDERLVARHPRAARADGVRQIRREQEADRGEEHHREHPEIPRDDETRPYSPSAMRAH